METSRYFRTGRTVCTSNFSFPYLEWNYQYKKNYFMYSVVFSFFKGSRTWRMSKRIEYERMSLFKMIRKLPSCETVFWIARWETKIMLSLLTVKVLVTQSCPTLCDPMDCSPPGFSVHGIRQAGILEWVAIPFSRGSSQSRDQTQVSCIAGWFFTIIAKLLCITGLQGHLCVNSSFMHLICP